MEPNILPKMLVKSIRKRRKRTARMAKEGSKKRPRKEHVPRPSSHPIVVRGKPIGHIYSAGECTGRLVLEETRDYCTFAYCFVYAMISLTILKLKLVAKRYATTSRPIGEGFC